jgi:hypothetical protein
VVTGADWAQAVDTAHTERKAAQASDEEEKDFTEYLGRMEKHDYG